MFVKKIKYVRYVLVRASKFQITEVNGGKPSKYSIYELRSIHSNEGTKIYS